MFAGLSRDQEPSESAPEYGVPSGFGEYFRQKQRKLQQQYAAQVPVESALFAGVTIYVDGFTTPSANELKQLILAHGGSYTLYLTSAVTHVVCENLPHAKLVLLRPSDRIVRPAWMVQSLQAGRLLPIDAFIVATPLRDSTQRTLAFASTSSTSAAAPPPPTTRELHFSAAEQPREFLRQFYEKSRLHHLSTWKAQLQADLQDFVARQVGVQLIHANDDVRERHETILYVDMDCFFAAVSIAKRPHLAGQPVVVCHVEPTSTGHADIASANYEARKFGIRNGMWMVEAKRLCPALVSVPYDFAEYADASEKLYACLLKHSKRIEVRSCDEAVCGVSCGVDDALQVAHLLRADIQRATGCSASVGVGASIFSAKLACRFAKPNSDGRDGAGAHAIPPRDLLDVIAALPIRSLPGVGHQTAKRLVEMHTGQPAPPQKARRERKPDASESSDSSAEEAGGGDRPAMTVGDLRAMELPRLQAEFGAQIGLQLYQRSRGIDARELRCFVERKTIGAEVNYGIRFSTMQHVQNFVRELALELERRAHAADYRGSTLSLKLKQAEADAGEALKFMGHGIAFNLSKSTRFAEPTTDANLIAEAAMQLYRSLACPPDQLRGIGLHLTNLERGAAVVSRQPSIRNAIAAAAATAPSERPAAAVDALPPKSQVDPDVWEALPSQVRRELESAYGEPSVAPPPRSPPQAAPPKAAAKRKAKAPTAPKRRRQPAAADVAAPDRDLIDVIGQRVYDMIDVSLRRQLAADVKAGNERRRVDSESLWFADQYLAEIDLSVLESLSPQMACEQLRERRRIAAVSFKELEREVQEQLQRDQQQEKQQQQQQEQEQLQERQPEQQRPDESAQHLTFVSGSGGDARLAVRRWLAEQRSAMDASAFLQRQLVSMVSRKQLDCAHLVVYELRRRAIAVAEREWLQCFNDVLTETQNALHGQYRALFAFGPLSE
jgi:DNA repair protein REV1